MAQHGLLGKFTRNYSVIGVDRYQTLAAEYSLAEKILISLASGGVIGRESALTRHNAGKGAAAAVEPVLSGGGDYAVAPHHPAAVNDGAVCGVLRRCNE